MAARESRRGGVAMDVRDAVVVVTGGSQGIGRAVCERFAREGARVAILDVCPADETLRRLHAAGCEARHFSTDVGDADAVGQAFARLDEDWGAPAVLVNVAGIFADVPFLETDVETWDRIMAVNARGIFLCSQAAARLMVRERRGSIVNMLSTASAQAFALESAYCASKGAALLLTRVMAVELAPYGITVNGVGPGTIMTEMGSEYLGGGPIAAHELSRTPMGRFGDPEDVAESVFFFAARARWTTGQALYTDGGFLAAGLPALDGLLPDAPAAGEP
jgi:NAD(P)-dependent dehydrogenase (short-subunit alcohol dehydrogenase family)